MDLLPEESRLLFVNVLNQVRRVLDSSKSYDEKRGMDDGQRILT